MNKFLVLLVPAIAAIGLSACNRGGEETAAAAGPAPLTAPTGTDDAAWRDYLRQVVTRNMGGVTGSPYMYYLPAPPAGTASPEDVAANAEQGADEGAAADTTGPSIASTGQVTDGTDYESVYTRQLENVRTVVQRTVPQGNMLAFGSPDSSRMANLIVAAFQDAAPGSMNGVRLLFVGAAQDDERVAAAVEPSGVDYVFVEAK
ncbi:hypothetical protein [Coralloluteibacterium thermophilus]|uniref:Lipoprotein n=1 Tax=Coralloluteibacterium thermophilum TaxID=2707049 RepID=A0ABV9NM70_9GAMM